MNTEQPPEAPPKSLDHTDVWKRAVLLATGMGVLHATMGNKRACSEKQVCALLTRDLGKFTYRNFHGRLLRAAYGAGFNGIAKVREAKKRGF